LIVVYEFFQDIFLFEVIFLIID